jgi:hypothetical protein
MLSCAYIVLVILGKTGENLLLNPSFENVSDGKAADWALFVTAEPSAEGRVDDKTFCDGRHAAMLRNAEAYANEPDNNWSQNIVKELAGKTLIVGGLIKTEKAGGADIWLQCWRRDPWGVLLVARTSDAFPVSDTEDWTPVAMKVTAPSGTDFVTVRCVLKGAGTAWFDDIRAVEADTNDSVDSEVEELAKNLPHWKGKSREEVAKGVLRETKSLSEGVQELKKTNEALKKELEEVRKQLEDLHSEIKGAAKLESKPEPRVLPAAPGVSRGAPPLVPHGADWKELVNAG